MQELGYALNDSSPPANIGRDAAQATIDSRKDDGSNQFGDEPGTPPNDVGKPYADYTGYASRLQNTWKELKQPWHWQPQCVLTPAGVTAGVPFLPPPGQDCVAPNYAAQLPYTPQWGNVTPFALDADYQYTPTGPPKLADGSYDPTDVATALKDTANLDDTKKVTAEYWADGPRSEFPPGHWALIAQVLSRKRGHSLDYDAKMFFALGNALMDASIAAWAAKFRWDFVRPITAIRNGDLDPRADTEKDPDWTPLLVTPLRPQWAMIAGPTLLCGYLTLKDEDPVSAELETREWDAQVEEFMALVARITRASVIEVLSQDHIRTARAKGLDETRVVTRHVLRNALLPMVTLIGLDLGALLGGAVITETVFNLQGIGQWAVQSVFKGDLPAVLAVTIVTAMGITLMNLVVDIFYAYLDPRVRYT